MRGPIHPGVFLESINQRSIKSRTPEQPINVEAEKGTKPEQVAAANQASHEEYDSMATEQDDITPKGPAWTKPFLKYLIHDSLSKDVAEARRVSRRSKAFTIINKQL